MGIKAVDVELQGKSALLMHRYPLEPIAALEKKPAMEQAELAAYRDPDTDELYVPGVAVQRAMIGAAVYSKGKGRASLQKQTAACLMVSPERLGLGTKEFNLDSRAVVMPATKGRVVRHRPRIDQWKIRFTLEWDEELLSEVQLRQIVDDMGSRVGLLDFRPERKGPFGRCYVTEWHVVDLEKS